MIKAKSSPRAVSALARPIPASVPDARAKAAAMEIDALIAEELKKSLKQDRKGKKP